MNGMQLERFRAVGAEVSANRYSLANSGGIGLGREYSFDSCVLESRSTGRSPAGGWRATSARWPGSRRRSSSAAPSARRERRLWRDLHREQDTEAAILNIGYADGYLRGFSSRGSRVRPRICAAGARPRLDGPDRRGLRHCKDLRRATGSSSTTTCRALRSSPAFRSTELVTTSVRGSSGAGLSSLFRAEFSACSGTGR